MTSANKMRIICDPFKKEILYHWYDFNTGTYVNLDSKYSKLASDKFIHTTIQNRAHEILEQINDEYNGGNVGLEIAFIGSEDDYSTFCDVIANYYDKVNISCIRDSYYYNTANFVLPKIEEKFSQIETTLDEYKEGEIANLVSRYKETVKPSISLCMMGLYSAGKSAFINSIIGSEILPSASDPTTAKVFKIYCAEKNEIRFWFDDKECILTFQGATYKSNCNFEVEIIKKLQGLLDEEPHNEISHMNRALKILNDYINDEHTVGDLIEIYIPFTQTALPVKEFKFIIYDTPGSNSAHNRKHFEILKDSLDSQTNALPIFLTTPDTMDAEDNDKILKLIEDTGTSLDTTNTIVIVNKADDKGEKSLKEKQKKHENLRITKWKSTRIFFVSSVMAIASKKNNPDNINEWIDEDMYELYHDRGYRYTSDERKLFEFNIVDKSKADDGGYRSSDKAAHLYKNSGLESVEKEIVEYARRYALYNKCQQASDYLQKAIDLCVETVHKIGIELGKKYELTQRHYNSEQEKLFNQLNLLKEKFPPDYNAQFQQQMNLVFGEFTQKNHLSDDNKMRDFALQEEFTSKWKELKKAEKKEKNTKGWALSQIQQYVDMKYNGLLRDFAEKTNAHIKSFWNEKSVSFKERCLKVIHDSDELTDEQKKILEAIIFSKSNMSIYRMEFNLRKLGAIKKKKFLFVISQGETFDIKTCCKQFIRLFNDAVRASLNEAVTNNTRNFTQWTDLLIYTLEKDARIFNSGLNSLDQEIKALIIAKESKESCQKMLTDSQNYIDALLDIQE